MGNECSLAAQLQQSSLFLRSIPTDKRTARLEYLRARRGKRVLFAADIWELREGGPPLREQPDRELVNCHLQFQKRSQYLIGTDDKTPPEAARVHNPDCAALAIQR